MKDNATTQVRIGFILKTEAAFNEYVDATGKAPPKMPDGCNTYSLGFTTRDEDGTERAAILIYQTGFEQTRQERLDGDEASGFSVAIALNVPVEQGMNALSMFYDRLMERGGNGAGNTPDGHSMDSGNPK